MQDLRTSALFTETARKAGVCWLALPTPDGRTRDTLAWHVWHDGALLVVSGPDEQQLPGLLDGAEVEVALRSSDTGGLLVRRRCRVTEVRGDDPRWDGCAAAALAGRLNHGDRAATLERWRGSAALHLLEP